MNGKVIWATVQNSSGLEADWVRTLEEACERTGSGAALAVVEAKAAATEGCHG
jgi:hypothetical protein